MIAIGAVTAGAGVPGLRPWPEAGGDGTQARKGLRRQAWILTPETGFGKKERGCCAARCKEEPVWDSALEKRRSQRLQKTRDAGALDKERIVPGRGQS